MNSKLDQSQQLQNKFDVWAGNWLGGKKRAALKEAASEIAQRNTEDLGRVKEVYENQKFDALSRTWKGVGFTLVTTPTVAAPELFDPAAAFSSPDSSWKADFSSTGIDTDAEGWTFADNFNTLNTR